MNPYPFFFFLSQSFGLISQNKVWNIYNGDFHFQRIRIGTAGSGTSHSVLKWSVKWL